MSLDKIILECFEIFIERAKESDNTDDFCRLVRTYKDYKDKGLFQN